MTRKVLSANSGTGSSRKFHNEGEIVDMNKVQEFIKQGRAVQAIRSVLKLFDRRFLLRVLLNMTGIFFLIQVITLIILQVVSFQRRGRQQAANFPHPCFDDVVVGANRLRIYDYGKDLYVDMLRAIDEAKERIYLETYIWKGDEIGQ